MNGVSMWTAVGLVAAIGVATFTPGPAARGAEVFQDYVAARIGLCTGVDAVDLAPAPDGATAWLADGLGNRVLLVDLARGQVIRVLSGIRHPSVVHWRPTDGRLCVVHENEENDHRGAAVRIIDATTGKTERSIPVADWRLYGVAGAAFSDDGKRIWLTSAPTLSQRYGHVPAALFRVDLEAAKWEQVAGQAPDAQTPLPRTGDRSGSRQALADERGRLFVASLEPETVSVLSKGAGKPDAGVKLGFEPVRLCRVNEWGIAAAGIGRIALIDTEKMSVIRDKEFEGAPSAVCVDRSGRRIYIAVHDTNRILVWDILAGFKEPIELDKKANKDVRSINRLFWRDKPERLIGTAADGRLPFTLDLKDGAFVPVKFPKEPRGLATGPGPDDALVCFGSGHVAAIDLKAATVTKVADAGEWLSGVVWAGDNTAFALDGARKCVLRIDLAAGKVAARIPLDRKDAELVQDPTGKQVAAYWMAADRTTAAIIDAKDNNIQYYPLLKDIPNQWRDIHKMATKWGGGGAHGPKTLAGIAGNNERDGSFRLFLTNRSEVSLKFPVGCTNVRAAAVDQAEQHVLLIYEGWGEPSLIRLFLTPRSARPPRP